MKLRYFLFVSVASSVSAFGQAAPSPTPAFSETATRAIANMPAGQVTQRERREQAIAKLFEGQRHVWRTKRSNSPAANAVSNGLAREAFQKAVEFDPAFAEGYTALAELEINRRAVGENEVVEAINLASIATRIEPDNFGGHRLLARLYSYKSGLKNPKLNPVYSGKAISGWKQVTRLDPRNAEAWAFLSEFYAKTNKSAEQIEALRNWLGSAPPDDVQFYAVVMGSQESLQPETASIKLGTALLQAGRTQEAIETLSVVVADDPGNAAAIDILREALEETKGEMASVALLSLKQAVFANPGNVSLINLLARVYARLGKIEEAAKLLRTSAAKLISSDRESSSSLFISLGDLYNEAEMYSESAAAFEESLAARGLDNSELLAGDEREFVMFIFEKLIQTHKAADRRDSVLAVINRAGKVFGKGDLFSDRQLISFLRETGKKPEALATVRSVRLKYPNDYGFIRLEATMLTETGKVDEAVALIKKLMEPKHGLGNSPELSGTGVSLPLPAHDKFSNYLFISNLYSQANRGKEASEAANQAYAIAVGGERKQIAKLTLATAQQMSGDFSGAEGTLRELIKQTPGNPIALNNLGYFLLERNDRFEEAFGLIEQALKVDPTNPSYLDSLGWAYFKLGKLAEAEKHLKDAARIDAGSSAIYEHLGDVYQKQGKSEFAKTYWQKALNLASDPADISRLKGKLSF
ncbi:MAG: tetratricopeptide repeat protein [Pyrinomonadaceae bacterium]